MNNLHRVRGIAYVCLFVFAAGLAPAVQAQQGLADKSELWWNQLERQVSLSVDSSVDQIQTQSLQHIIFFATHYPEKVDFKGASASLIKLYAQGADEGHRVLALMAIHATGNKLALRHLAMTVDQEASPKIQQLTRRVLAEHLALAAL